MNVPCIVFMVSLATHSWPCDVDMDGDIDKVDIAAISVARNTYTYSGDSRDSTGDGLIHSTDATTCVGKATRPSSAD